MNTNLLIKMWHIIQWYYSITLFLCICTWNLSIIVCRNGYSCFTYVYCFECDFVNCAIWWFWLSFLRFCRQCFQSTRSISSRWTQGNAFGVTSAGICCESQVNQTWYRSCSIKLRQIIHVIHRLEMPYNKPCFTLKKSSNKSYNTSMMLWLQFIFFFFIFLFTLSN